MSTQFQGVVQGIDTAAAITTLSSVAGARFCGAAYLPCLLVPPPPPTTHTLVSSTWRHVFLSLSPYSAVLEKRWGFQALEHITSLMGM